MSSASRVAPDPVAIASGTSSSAAIQSLPRGEIALIKIATDSGGTGSTEVVESVTFTCPTDARRIIFLGAVKVRSNVGGGVSVRLLVDSVQIQRANDTSLGAGKDLTLPIYQSKTFDAGDHTLDLVIGISGINPGGQVVTAIAGGETDEDGVIVVSVIDMGEDY